MRSSVETMSAVAKASSLELPILSIQEGHAGHRPHVFGIRADSLAFDCGETVENFTKQNQKHVKTLLQRLFMTLQTQNR